LALLASGQLAFAEDQARPSHRANGRAAAPDAQTVTPNAPKPGQAVVRRPTNAPLHNPNFRPLNPVTPSVANSVNTPGMANRNRAVLPNNRIDSSDRSGRTSAVKPNERTAISDNNRVHRTLNRLPRGNGTELSFIQARARCSRDLHDRNWWRTHHTRVILYCGGYWFWNAGWWFPAWGYDPFYSTYVYDGPIYGYGQLPPGDVTMQVQEALAQAGYYYGPIDGVLGPETRDAILRFQADNGLATTAAIDEATLSTLGLT